MNAKFSYKNILSWLQGNLRYKIYYSKFSFLIPRFIKEQFETRVKSIPESCYLNGSCDLCGCETTKLQFANKPCAGSCYPEFLSKKEWVRTKLTKFTPDASYYLHEGKFKKININPVKDV
jgi:hypothetical protein